jgi:5,10-methylenetetrahydromethanopterin reductase
VSALAPVVDDLSAYIAGGRIRSSRQVIEEAIEAERLGLRRVWLSERYDLKEVGVLLGAMAASTSRLELGTAALIPISRPVIVVAAMGATLHSAYGPRLALGLGRSMDAYISSANLQPITRRALMDYADLYRRLWRGETIDYDGPAGSFRDLHMADHYDGAPPQIWAVHFGGPKACEMSASTLFDGVYLTPFLTECAVAAIVERLRVACERWDRDPTTLRICLPIISAPELPDEQARAYMHARMVTYLGQPRMAEIFCTLNDWDVGLARPVREHPMFADDPDRVDHNFHREDLIEVAKLVPDEWMYSTSLTGSIEDCVAKMRAYRDLGVDEISTYGSTPSENAGLIRAWREARAVTTSRGES